MKVSSSLNRKLGAILSIVNLLVSVLIGMVYTPICVRCLGQSDYGLYTFAFGLVGYLSILDFGFGSALVRYSSRLNETNSNETNNLYGFFLILFSVIGFIAFGIGLSVYFNMNSIFANSFTSEELFLLSKIFPLLLINVSLSFPFGVFSAIIQAHEKFVFLRVVDIVKSICSHLIVILVLLLGYKVYALTLITVCFSFVVYLVNTYYCFFKLNVRFGFNLTNIDLYKQIVKYSFFVFLGMIGTKLYDETDKLVLGYFCGSKEVALYGVAITFQMYFQILALSLTNVFFPLLNRILVSANADVEISQLFNKISHFLLVILEFIIVGFLVFGREFTVLWVGNDYINSYIIALIILLPSLVPFSQYLGNSILEAMNRHRVNSIMYFVMALFNVIISIPLAIRFGGIGAAIGTAVGTILARIVFINWYYVNKIGLKVKEYWMNFIIISIKYVPVLLVMYFSNFLFSNSSWTFLIIKILLSLIVCVPYVYMFILNEYEKNLVLNFVNFRSMSH